MPERNTFETTVRRDAVTGYTYNPHAARRQGRLHEFADVKLRIEVRGWQNGLPLFGLIVVAERVASLYTGDVLFDEEDEIALTDAERRDLRVRCAETMRFIAEEERRDIPAREYEGPGADECFDFEPDYHTTELVEVGQSDRLPAWWYADAA